MGTEEEFELIALSVTEFTLGLVGAVVQVCQHFTPDLLRSYIEILDIKLEDEDDGIAVEVLRLGRAAAQAVLDLDEAMGEQVRSMEAFNSLVLRYMAPPEHN